MGPRQPNRARGRVGAVLAEAHHLGAGHDLDQPFGELHFQLGRQAEGDAARELLADRRIDIRVAVAEHDRQ